MKDRKAVVSVVLGVLILISLGGGIVFWLSNKSISQASQTTPSTPSTETAANAPSSNPTSIHAPVTAPPAPSSSVTMLPMDPDAPEAKILPATVLPAGWSKDYQPYNYAGPLPYFRGEPVKAYVEAGGKKTILQPDQGGVFPRLFLDPGAKTNVVLQFPQGTAGEHVAISTADGGYLNQSDAGEILTLNDSGTATFQFTLSSNRGVSRVNVQRGTEITTLDFWAGPDNQYPQLTATNLKSK